MLKSKVDSLSMGDRKEAVMSVDLKGFVSELHEVISVIKDKIGNMGEDVIHIKTCEGQLIDCLFMLDNAAYQEAWGLVYESTTCGDLSRLMEIYCPSVEFV